MSNDRGSITLWALGMSLLLFAVGFLALDLWSGFAARNEAAAIAVMRAADRIGDESLKQQLFNVIQRMNQDAAELRVVREHV